MRHVAPGNLAFLFAALIAAAVWSLALWKVGDDSREVHANAQSELLGAQNLLAAHFARAIDTAVLFADTTDRWMSEQRASFSESADQLALESFIEGFGNHQSFSIRLRLFDAAANRIALPSFPEPEFNIADREYITDLENKSYDFFKIGLQSRSRATGDDIIPISKIARPNIFKVKYIVAVIDVPDLNQLFDRIFITAPGYVGAFREDGYLIYRNPDPDRYVGIKLDLDYFMGSEVMRNDLGVILNRKDTDGRELTVAYKHIERHPIYVYASFRNADLDNSSLARLPIYFGFATLATLLSFAMDGLIAYFAHIREREAAALRAALITADAANIAKRDFLANVSHELRTPLNAIIGFSEMIGTGIFGKLTEKNAEYNDDVVTAARHLLTVVDQLLDIAAIEAGRASLRPEELDLTPFLRDIAHMLAAKAASRNVAIDAIAPDGRRILYADKRVLRQILLNVIAHAIKHSQPNGRVRVGWRESAPGRISIFVADQGVGIAPDELPHIFEPFWRSSDAYIARPDGVGLGLMVTKQLVAQSGGTISVESALGRGSEFAIDIPDTAVPIAAVPSRAA
ncbi:MAG: sensor histidine kinase [Alphaproteobacteria bacterium]|nr:sensor histidine kinase [Alphaproteobacteria bacterium]